jgi:phage replication protein O protein
MNEFIPNSFQIANAVIDEYLSQMSGNALKCYILIVRKTRGWQKTHDSLSISQIQKFTGIKKEETVQKAINELVDLGLIGKQSRIGLPNEYFLISDPKKGVTPPPKMGGGPPPKKGGHINTKYKKQISTNVDINTAREETAKKPTKHEADLALLAEHGIAGQIAEDFLTIRKAKRQPLTETAMRLIAADAEKCGMTAAQAVEYAIGNGWGSFRAEWLKNKTFGRSVNRGGLTHIQTADVMDGRKYGDKPTTDF